MQSAVLFLGLSSDYMDRLLKSYDKKDELQRFLFHALRRQKPICPYVRLPYCAATKIQTFFYHLFHRTFGIHPMDYRMSSRYDSDPI